MTRRALYLAPVLFSSWLLQAQDPQLPSDAEIRTLLANRIDVGKQSVGMVVGIVTPAGRRIISYGSLDNGDTRPLNGNTVYEIGSMSKVFTSLVLMDMVQKGEVSLDDPVAKYLPAEAKVPERGGRKITLRDLSTQTSGLPRMPSNFHPKDPGNPYADYTEQQLWEFISGYTLPRDIGEKYEYSNLGVALLGQALARRAGTDWETLVRTRILKPLEMHDTSVTLSADQKSRLAVGHNGAMKAVPNWDLPTFAGAGALRSTANDVLTFLAANLGLIQTKLAAAMAAEISVHRSIGTGMEIAYGWHIFTSGKNPIYWHNGGTGGYRTFMGFDPQAKLGVVVLSNASAAVAVGDQLGHHLLDPNSPFAPAEPKKEHKAITLDPKVLDGFVGQYQLAPGVIVTVSRDGDRLFAQATGQGRFEIFPESQKDFFAKEPELQVSFDIADGKVSSMTIMQEGQKTVAKRLP
jgi:D-alanyl-D-alanine-carboxypeptidase/D-alanyl-D-alanine-endopeptidase